MYGALILFEDEFIHIVAISFTALILTELIMVALTVRTWHYIIFLAELLSLGLYVLSLIVLKDTFGKFKFSCGMKDNIKIICRLCPNKLSINVVSWPPYKKILEKNV